MPKYREHLNNLVPNAVWDLLKILFGAALGTYPGGVILKAWQTMPNDLAFSAAFFIGLFVLIVYKWIRPLLHRLHVKYIKNPAEPPEKKKDDVALSVKQTMTGSPGGIQVARDYIVNQGIPPRMFTPEQANLFLQILKSSPKGDIRVQCIESGGPEPCNFARQIAGLLESAGWVVKFAPLMFGSGDPTKTIPEIYILVRKNESPPIRAIALQAALKMVGVNADGIPREDEDDDFVQLTVWFQGA